MKFKEIGPLDLEDLKAKVHEPEFVLLLDDGENNAIFVSHSEAIALIDWLCAAANHCPVMPDCQDAAPEQAATGGGEAMTIATKLAGLPEMPKREDTDKWIALFPGNDVIKAAATAGFYEAEASSLRARLSLALEVLKVLHDNTAEYITINHLGDPHHNQDMQNARLVLEAMKELR